MAKSIDNDKVESPSRDRNTDLQDTGISDSGHVATVHNTQLPPPFMSLILGPQALAVDALSQHWHGRCSCTCFPVFLAEQGNLETLSH